MNLYIDESGIITTSNDPKLRYFVIGAISTEEPNHVIRQFREAKKKYVKNNPDSNINLKTEIKGSAMPYGMKKLIFETLTTKTDAMFHFVLVDNNEIYPNLVQQPSLTFNYMISIGINSLSRKQLLVNRSELFMLIDERNQAVESLNSLEEYMKIEFTIKRDIFDTVRVKYKDSQSKDLIQLADIFCNTIHRIAKNHSCDNYDKKNRNLLKVCNIGICDYFPYRKNDIDICF